MLRFHSRHFRDGNNVETALAIGEANGPSIMGIWTHRHVSRRKRLSGTMNTNGASWNWPPKQWYWGLTIYFDANDITTLRNACPYWQRGIPSNWTGFRPKPESPKEPVSPGRATRERPHTDRVITVDPRTPARPTSNTQEAGKTTTEQPSSEEVAVDPGSPTQPQSPAAGKTATEQPSVEEVAADPGSPTGPQSPAAGKTTTEQPSVEEVAVDPGSPTQPQSPAAAKTTTEQSRIEEVPVDPGSPTEPQSPAAGKTATEQPSVEEVAVDPGSPTGAAVTSSWQNCNRAA